MRFRQHFPVRQKRRQLIACLAHFCNCALIFRSPCGGSAPLKYVPRRRERAAAKSTEVIKSESHYEEHTSIGSVRRRSCSPLSPPLAGGDRMDIRRRNRREGRGMRRDGIRLSAAAAMISFRSSWRSPGRFGVECLHEHRQMEQSVGSMQRTTGERPFVPFLTAEDRRMDGHLRFPKAILMPNACGD